MATSGWKDVSAADIARLTRQPAAAAPPKRSKFKNVRCEAGGFKFDSQKEAEHWLLLRSRLANGEIRDLRRQIHYELYCPTPDRAVFAVVSEYVADYDYYEGDQHVVSDAKGHRTREYLMKRKWLELQEGIVIREV